MRIRWNKTENEPEHRWSFGSKATAILTAVFLAAFCVILLVFNADHSADPDASRLTAVRAASTPYEVLATQTPSVQHALVTTQPIEPGSAGVNGAASGQPLYSFTLTIAGRAAFESDITQTVLNDDGYRFEDILAAVSPYIHADHNLVFLDNLIADDGQNYTDLSAPKECTGALRSAGFDTVVLGNETVLDRDIDALNTTRAALLEQGMKVAGVAGEDGQRIRYININGANIALLAYSEKLTKTTQQMLEIYPDEFAEYTDEQVKNDIFTARQNGAMFIIVFLHWGDDDASAPTEAQQQAALDLCSYGAHLIIGTRTQCPIAPEYVTSVDALTGRTNTALVAYSLGSLITENRDNRNKISSYLLNLNVTCSASEAKITNAGYVPLYIWKYTISEGNRFYTVCSSEEHEGMNEKQRGYMDNSLQLVRRIMQNTSIHEDR